MESTWIKFAKCKNKNLNDFFDYQKIEDCLRICSKCRVKTHCKQEADKHSNTIGVFGNHIYNVTLMENFNPKKNYHGSYARAVACDAINNKPCGACQKTLDSFKGSIVSTSIRSNSDREHGTLKGYRQHQKNKEVTCHKCRLAVAEYRQTRYNITRKPVQIGL